MRRASEIHNLRRSSLISLSFGADVGPFPPEGDFHLNMGPSFLYAKGADTPHSPESLLDLVLEEPFHAGSGMSHPSQPMSWHMDHQQMLPSHHHHNAGFQVPQLHSLGQYGFEEGAPFASLEEQMQTINFSRSSYPSPFNAQLPSKKRKQPAAGKNKKQRVGSQFQSLPVTPTARSLKLNRNSVQTVNPENKVVKAPAKGRATSSTTKLNSTAKSPAASIQQVAAAASAVNGNKPKPQKRSRNQSSKFRGVSKCSKDGRWQARIRVGATVKYLGRFKVEEDAARCYDEAAQRLHGKRAQFNFPELLGK